MIKQALEYIVGLKKPEIIEVYGEKYSDKNISRISKELRAEKIRSTTLTSIVDYINKNSNDLKGSYIVHVVSPNEVSLISQLDADRDREILIAATALVPKLVLNEYQDTERFIIMLQAMFEQDDTTDLAIVQKVAGTVVDETIQDYKDDGVSQKATIKSGLKKEDVEVPNPVKLIPYRTFTEVEQPISKFVFRMRQGRGTPECALFEGDGGAWRNLAMDNIKAYFIEAFKDHENITVIS